MSCFLFANPLGWEVGCSDGAEWSHSRCGERSFWISALFLLVGGSPGGRSVCRQQPGRLSRELGQAPDLAPE